ncbi:outer membrane beta-barrel protein [Pontiellaceae bacterium B12219]|nr:outer membrane beta-barrel protein [Pontiellaceae bacterium B12219]
MKKMLQTSLFALAALTISATAGSPYLGLSGGLTLLSESDVSDSTGDIKLSYDTGYNIEGAFGYTFGAWRAEAALGWLESDMDQATFMGVSVPIDGSISAWTAMLNGYYDINTDSAFTPFVLAGIGFVGAEGELSGATEDDSVLGMQLGAGIGYTVSSNVIIDLKYKYLFAQDLTFDGTDISVGGSLIQIGARYNF